MGAWGYGVLQNDTAQDGICDVANTIEEHICKLKKKGSIDSAAVLGAATGILLQFSPYSFNPESNFYPDLVEALKNNKPFFSALPAKAVRVLETVLEGKSETLLERPGTLDKDIDKALKGDEEPKGFIMEKEFSYRDIELFSHPVARQYIQEVVDDLVAEVDEGFKDEEQVSDISREGYFMGAFGLLLVLEPCKIDPEYFLQWQNRFNKVWQSLDFEPDELEDKFNALYNANLYLAFDCGIKKFTVT